MILSLVKFDEFLYGPNMQAQLDFLRTGFTYGIRVSMVIQNFSSYYCLSERALL